MSRETHSDEDIQGLLPQYASGSLSPAERQQVETWLEKHPGLSSEVVFWQELQAGLQSQPQTAPRQEVWQGLSHQVALQQRQAKRNAISILAGLALAGFSLVILWLTIRPGVLLQWTVSGTDQLTYQVYRAPAGSQDFVLLGEVHGTSGVTQYSFLDALFLPGQSYVYRVEGVSPSGLAVVSQGVVSQSIAALPGQLAILLASLLVGYLAASLARNWDSNRPGRLLPA
jgi:hypothetical protein